MTCPVYKPILHSRSHTVSARYTVTFTVRSGSGIPRRAAEPNLLIRRLLIDHVCPMFPQFER